MIKKLVLSNSNNAKSFADTKDEFLQEEAFNDVCQLIKNISVSNTHSDEDDTGFYSARGHYNILVNGMRGSGKTTFALTAAKILEKGGDNGFGKGDIINLGILDPTLIDTKEHVLLAIISKIKEVVMREGDSACPANKRNNDSIFNRAPHPLDRWREQLTNLAKGLQQLDGVGKDPMQDSIWEDPITIMEEGLGNIHAGLELNKQLHLFIDESLKMLGAKKFILVLDDVDTFFQKGWPVLEALRKFITTPQLITLVCGDFQLYYTQVKRQQWEQLGSLVTQYENSSDYRPKHESMVRMLTEQYLLKVLPANRRVDLKTVADLDESIRVSQTEEHKENEAPTIKCFINKMLQKNFKTFSGTVEEQLFYNYLSRQPIRLIIQLLNSLKNEELNTSSLQNIFSDWVYREGAAALLQDSRSNTLLIQQLLSILGSSDIMQDDLELLPRYISDHSNMGAIVSSRLLCDYFIDNPAAAIDFMIRGGLTRQAIYFIGNNKKARPSPEKIMYALSATTSDDLLTVTRQWAPVAVHGLGEAANISINRGTVQLLSEGSIRKQRSKKALKNLYRTTSPELVRAYASAQIDVQGVVKNSAYRALAKGMFFLNDYYTQFKTRAQSQHYAISPVELKDILNNLGRPEQAQLLGLLFVNVSEGNNNFYRATSLNLIAFMERLISTVEKDNNSEASKEKSIQKIKQEFKRASQIRTYPVPVDFTLLSESNAENDEDDIDDPEDEKYNQASEEEPTPVDLSKPDIKFYDEIYEWLKEWSGAKNKISYPPFVWSRIWQRFYYTLEQQDNNLDAEHRFLGVIIHRQIIAFLNSILIEELRYKADGKELETSTLSVNLDNPVNSDDIFLKNIKSIKPQSPKPESEMNLEGVLPLYQLVSSFPVWFSFLSSDVEGFLIKEVTSNKKLPIELDNSADCNLKDLINLIPLARTEKQLPTIWTHHELKNIIFKDTNIVNVLQKLYEKFTLPKEANKSKDKDKEFIRAHLSRTSSEATVSALKEALAVKK